jgi:nucleotide-binding universal stress UspA family protein
MKEVTMRILLAVDGSRAADQARDLVAALPWRESGRVRIVSVAPPPSDLSSVAWMVDVRPDLAETDDQRLRVHRDALETAEREIRCANADLPIETILGRGRPASVIVEEARAMPADLVVVGHRGHGAWESMLLGSVSSEVVDHAPCPVLVARDERLGPVVFADDGSPGARLAEGVLANWPMFAGLPVTVVSVAPDTFPYASALAVAPMTYPGVVDQYADSVAACKSEACHEAAHAAGRLRSVGFSVADVMREGDPAHEIVAVAQEREAGLIVLGSRGQTGLRRLILGSVARNVLLHAPCSVLIVREGVSPTLARSAEAVERLPVEVGR